MEVIVFALLFGAEKFIHKTKCARGGSIST